MTDGCVKTVSLAIFVLMSCAHNGPESATPEPALVAGDPGPYRLELNLHSVEGEVAMSSYGGRLVLLVLSIPACEACERVKPRVKRLAERLEAESISVSFVSILLERPEDRNMSESGRPVRWGDPRLRAGETALGVIDTVPVTWLLSRSGVPLIRYEGADTGLVARLEEDLRGYLRVETNF